MPTDQPNMQKFECDLTIPASAGKQKGVWLELGSPMQQAFVSMSGCQETAAAIVMTRPRVGRCNSHCLLWQRGRDRRCSR